MVSVYTLLKSDFSARALAFFVNRDYAAALASKSDRRRACDSMIGVGCGSNSALLALPDAMQAPNTSTVEIKDIETNRIEMIINMVQLPS